MTLDSFLSTGGPRLALLLLFLGGSKVAQAGNLMPQIAVNEGKQFGLVEIHLPLDKTYADPFNADEVMVQGHFQGPNGTVTDIDGFVDLDYVMTHSDKNKWDHVAPQGNAYWAVRFAPTQVGNYTWWVTRKDSAGNVASAKATFAITDDPTATGFIRVAPNHTHFQDDRGAAFYAIGADIAWPTGGGMFDFEKWFSHFSQNGGNSARVFMTWIDLPLERLKTPKGGWNMPIHTGYLKGYVLPDLNERTQNGANDPWSGLGKVDLANAWRYDYLLSLARKDGLRLTLCQVAGGFNGDLWPYSPYNKVNGGMLTERADFYSNPQAKAVFKRELRYIVARYGWSSNVLAWELVNEVDMLKNSAHQYPAAAVLSWHKEMAQYLKQIDPNKHFVTTSVALAERPDLFTIPEIDYSQGHPYNFQDSVPIVAMGNARTVAALGKPHLDGEFGLEFLQQKFEGGRWTDPKGVNIETGLWSSLASPGAGTVWLWWWDNYIEPENLWGLWKPVAQFAANVPWNKVHWKPLATPKISYVAVPPASGPRQTLEIIPGSWFHWNPAPNPYKVGTDGVLDYPVSEMPLYMKTATALHPLTFQVNYKQAGKFDVEIRFVGKKESKLEIRLDGKTLLSKDFPAGTGTKAYQFQYNAPYIIDVPAGPHTIQVANTASAPEGVFSAVFHLLNYLDPEIVPLHFCGMMGDDSVATLYFYNQAYTWGDVDAGDVVPPIAPSACLIPGLKPGDYNVETWSPSEGIMLKQEKMTATAAGLLLQLPQVTNDLAIKVLPVPNA